MDSKKIANYAAIALLMVTAGMNVAAGKYDTAVAIAALAMMVFLYNQKCEQLNAFKHAMELVLSKMLKEGTGEESEGQREVKQVKIDVKKYNKMNEKFTIKKRVLDYIQEHPAEKSAKVVAEACNCKPHTAYRYAWMAGKKLRMSNSDAPYHGRIHEIKDKAKELLSKFSKNEPLYALELAKEIGCNYITLYSYGREWGYKMHVSRPKKRRTDTVYARLSEEEKAQRRAERRAKYRMYGR